MMFQCPSYSNIHQLLRTINCFQSSSICFTGAKKTLSKVENGSTKRIKKTREKVSTEVIKYIMENNPKLDIGSVPENYLIRKKHVKIMYLIDLNVAETVVNVLRPHIENCKAEMIECNPGLGLLTSLFLKLKITRLNLHEPDLHFYAKLKKLKESSKVLRINNNDFVEIPKYGFAKKKLESILHYIKMKEWKDECAYQLVASLSNQDFLRYILRNVMNQDGLLSFGRPTMYLFITPTAYKKLIAGPHEPWNLYKPLAVLFQIIFNIELLLQVDRRAFIPWPSVTTYKKDDADKDNAAIGEDIMYLIKIEGKRELFDEFGQDIHKMKSLKNFVTHVIGRKKQGVISTIEQWIPGFGPHLIVRNINVYTVFNELTPDQIFEIYCLINQISRYEDFMIPASNTPGSYKEKIDTSIDLDLEEDPEEHDHEDSLEPS